MRSALQVLTDAAPYIWLFGSIFGVMISGVLMKRSYEQRVVLRATDRRDISRFWFRHALWFLILHSGYVVVGVIAVMGIHSTWSDLLTLGILATTPLALVYRSYDSLRAGINDE